MTLRVRLLIGILVLSAIGLLTLDVVSYRSLEGHLTDRIEQQADASLLPLGVNLYQKAGLDPKPGFSFGGSQLQVPKGGQLDQLSQLNQPGAEVGQGGTTGPFDSNYLGDVNAPPDQADREGKPPTELPPGTYGQLRSPSGKVLSTVSFSIGGQNYDVPDLSGDIPVSVKGQEQQYVTVGSRDDGSTDFLVTAREDFTGRTTVAAIPKTDLQETLSRLALIELIVTVSVLAALAALAWWVIGIGLRPLDRMSRTADEISRGDLSRRIETTDPKTEVGRLGISLNKMLDQIEEAFEQRRASEDRMRQFLADASHELRTPLASIRGYAELYRMGAIGDENEVGRAMGRIESESGRMGDLVDGLLTLARLDDMPDPVREPIDLKVLVEESRDDAHAIAPTREMTVTATGNLELEGDENQLRRLVSNLMRNAIVHTPDGSSIETSVDGSGETVVLEVRDHGDGFNDGDEERIFERFWRHSESRDRDSGGAGIGLAVVKAVAEAHGGEASARNADDGGAIFRIELPRNLLPESSQEAPTAS